MAVSCVGAVNGLTIEADMAEWVWVGRLATSWVSTAPLQACKQTVACR